MSKLLFFIISALFAGQLAASSFTDYIGSKVEENIQHTQSFPGLKPEEYNLLREGITNAWGTLLEKGCLEVEGTDKDVRPSFVALQGMIEQLLASEIGGQIKSTSGVIHTPMPATPLCTRGSISLELVDPAIENDPLRLFTVKARTTIVRDYLFKGGKLYIAYPHSGLEKRTDEQIAIYQQELKNYPEKLFDLPLQCDEIPADLIGATYLFKDQTDKTYVFAIRMTQAKDPQSKGQFGLWFGPIDHPAIQARIQAVSKFLRLHGLMTHK